MAYCPCACCRVGEADTVPVASCFKEFLFGVEFNRLDLREFVDPQPCPSCDGAAHPVVCEHPDVVSLGTGGFDPGLDAVVFPCLGVSPCEFFCLAGVEVAADPFAPVAAFERVDADGGGAVEVEVNQAEPCLLLQVFLGEGAADRQNATSSRPSNSS